MREHHTKKIINTLLLVIIFGLGFLGYQRYLDGTVFDPISVYDMPKIEIPYDSDYFSPRPLGDVIGIYETKTDKLEYAPGEEVFVYLSFCKYRNKTPVVRWSFINDIVADLGPRLGKIYEPGCYKNVKVSVGRVPDELSAALPDAQYRLHGTVTHNVNPLRKVSVLLVSNYFKIKKN